MSEHFAALLAISAFASGYYLGFGEMKLKTVSALTDYLTSKCSHKWNPEHAEDCRKCLKCGTWDPPAAEGATQ